MPPFRSTYKERIANARAIESLSFEMTLCSYCIRNDRKYVVSEASSARCSECVRRASSCDVSNIRINDLDSVIREIERIDRENEEATMKIVRLQKQKKMLSSRAKDMLSRNLKTMDELDAAKEKEREDKEREERAQAQANAAALAFPLVPDDLLDLPEF
jgi:hypothetical protein